MSTKPHAAPDAMTVQAPVPGLVALFGSGEISPSGRTVYDELMRRLRPPIRVAVLETPAGFQPNSALVAEEVAGFLRHRLQNHQPEVIVVPARARGTAFSPDEPATIAPLLDSNLVFLGPGSPTYAARQLQDSLAWYTLTGVQRLGAALVFASAATVAAGALVLPVYEIFKAGQDLHWQPGLDFFGAYGLQLVFVPHFNNAEGGPELDTSRCYMGRARFDRLLALLPTHVTVVGIDEHTALIMDICAGQCRVMGRGGITVLRDGEARYVPARHSLPIGTLGSFHLPHPELGLPEDVWASVRALWFKRANAAPAPPAEVVNLSQERSAARACGDWAQADALRQRIAALGWEIRDTPDGLILEALPLRGRQNHATPFGMAEAG